MKPRFSALLLFVVSLATAPFAAPPGWVQAAARSGAPAASGNPIAANPLKVALLDWYKANTTTTFTVGNEPNGVAFDGANIWVANFNDGTVSKLQANDGTVVGTFTIGAGVEPFGVTFDG